MENDRESRKKNGDDAPMSEDDDNESLYVTASDHPAQITINLDKEDTKRKITIISEVESPKRQRRQSADLRRQAMMNSARRRSQSTASSRSRSRSRGRSVSRSRRPSASVSRQRSPSQAELLAQIGGKSYTLTDSKSDEKIETPKKTPKKATPKKRSRSRTRSSNRSRSRSRSRSAGSQLRLRGRSVPRRRSTNGNRATNSRSRSLSRTRPAPPLPIQGKIMNKLEKKDEIIYPISPLPVVVPKLKKPEETSQTPSLRLPTHLCKRTIVGRNGLPPPEYIQLPSPLFILTEQQTIGACEKKTVQFVTKILLTSHKLSEEERKKLYAEMVEAEYVGTSRSSTDLRKASDEEPEEDFQLKIYYSARGIYIHSVQNVRKIRNGKKSRITEEKSYSSICKTKIIGDLGKSTEGLLNVGCSETVSVENQNYTRSEHFKIGFKDSNVVGDSTIHAVKTTFDPTKTTSFDEVIKFDSQNIGIDIFHTSTAAMETMWNHEMGSFGEEQSEYREIKFAFDDGKVSKTPELVVPPPVAQTPKPSISNNTSGSSSSKSSASETSRRSRSRSKRHKAIAKKNSLSNKISIASKSPDRQSSRKSNRPDEEPIKESGIKKADSLNQSSFYHSFPEATSTPKSPKNLTNSSILQSNAKSQTTPDKSPLRRGVISTREQNHSDNEIDLDKSLSAKKPTASKNLAMMVESKKKEEARQQELAGSMISAKPPTSPGNSVYLYQTGSAKNSTYMSAKDLHDARVSAASSKSSTSPQGIRRIKETKVTREVREEDGKPAEINEKKEETVKEEKVKLGKRSRSVSPATPNMTRPLDKSMVTLSAVKETHQTLEMTPIKVSDDSVPTQSSSIMSGQRAFREEVQMDLLIDKKRLVLNVNFMLLAEKQPEVEITGFCFKGQKLWEKSSEWNLSSANTTSHTKTVARQASDILGDGKDQEKK